MKSRLLMALLLVLTVRGYAETNAEPVDTAVARRSIVTRLLDYFNDANKRKPNKWFDFSIIRKISIQSN